MLSKNMIECSKDDGVKNRFQFDGCLEGLGTPMYQLLANRQISVDIEIVITAGMTGKMIF